MTSRRRFIQLVPLAGITLLGARPAHAVDVDPKEPQAAALGYVPDAAQVDKAKFPKYAPGQLCSNCQLYQGKPADAKAPCTLFQGKTVMGKGWCSAWVKKA